jgi:hypothetical protein
MFLKSTASALGLLATLVDGGVLSRSITVSFQDSIVAEAGGMHNVHINYNAPLDGELSMHYGDCEAITPEDCDHTLGRTHVGSHPLAARHISHLAQRPTRFVWLPPVDISSGGCLYAFSGDVLVGRSSPVMVTERKQKRWTAVSHDRDCTAITIS